MKFIEPVLFVNDNTENEENDPISIFKQMYKQSEEYELNDDYKNALKFTNKALQQIVKINKNTNSLSSVIDIYICQRRLADIYYQTEDFVKANIKYNDAINTLEVLLKYDDIGIYTKELVECLVNISKIKGDSEGYEKACKIAKELHESFPVSDEYFEAYYTALLYYSCHLANRERDLEKALSILDTTEKLCEKGHDMYHINNNILFDFINTYLSKGQILTYQKKEDLAKVPYIKGINLGLDYIDIADKYVFSDLSTMIESLIVIEKDAYTVKKYQMLNKKLLEKLQMLTE